ncbi:type II CAAX endopeptidase family protein [Kitasatospora sp. NPDC088779]|uniref:CPBP family intramembrane glutamic endopeptidase n=1 Tax=Kitasatospora sp. NPDC088779 TaxID=3154964 RepID=UPI0034286753
MSVTSNDDGHEVPVAVPGTNDSSAPDPPAAADHGRRLTWLGYALIVIVDLGIIQGLGAAIHVDNGNSRSQFPTTEAIVHNALIPIGASIVFVSAVITWLRWWPAVFRYRAPVRRWVHLVPISMIVAAVAGLNYGHLAQQQASLVVCLLVLGVFVGVGEELMFRGVGVQVFRRAGLSEGRTALFSSVVFGLVHVSNAISTGPQAIGQAVIVATSGYFFYLCLRVGGVILLPMLVHGLWDTSLISNLVGPEPGVSVGMVLLIALQIALIVVLIVRRKRIEPSVAVDQGPLA